MKAIQLKIPVIAGFIFLLTVLGFSGCGQQDSTKKPEATIDSVKPPVVNTPVTADTQVSVPVEKISVENTDHTKLEIKPDPKKEILPADKKKEPEQVKKFPAEKTPPPVTVVQPTENKPVIKTEKPPEVKIVEPEKPKQEAPPKTVEVPKPVTVVNTPDEPNDWVVLAKYKNMTNPFPVDKESMDLGRSLYGTHCKSCHGAKGDGKGPKAATLDTKIGSFLSADFRAQKPGEVYYKSIIGRKDMPRFDKKIPDEEERWAVVEYIMSLK